MGEEEQDQHLHLSKLFDQGYHLLEELEKITVPTNCKEYQEKVSKAIKYFEDATKVVNELSMFSANESIEEVPSNNLKYLLLPALLSNLTLKSQQTERIEIINVAEVYMKDYIQRLNDYQVCDIDIGGRDNENEDAKKATTSKLGGTLEEAARQRQDKIARYREGKEMDEKIKFLREKMEKKEEVDDEVTRDFYITLLKRWINIAHDELKNMELEKPILEHMAQMKALGNPIISDRNVPKPKRLKPIIIAKTEMQKKVYGLGYPAVPTVTIDEFVNQKLKEGTLSITDPNVYNNSLITWAEDPEKKIREDDQHEADKERKIEMDDAESLAKSRAFDEWKDEHRRGEGNRKNMG